MPSAAMHRHFRQKFACAPRADVDVAVREERQVEVTRSRLKTWLRSPRIPARRLGQVDFSMREAALAVGMSPAREPPGTSPGSPSGSAPDTQGSDESARANQCHPIDSTIGRFWEQFLETCFSML
eukprot:s4634_g7.t1